MTPQGSAAWPVNDILRLRLKCTSCRAQCKKQGEAQVASITLGKRVLAYVCTGLLATFQGPIWVSSNQILVIVVNIS
jgi:hypothetical protein